MQNYHKTEDPVYKILVRISVVLFIFFSLWLIWDHFINRPAEVKHYLMANNAFKDKNYDLALNEYFVALKFNQEDVYSIEGVARSYMELNLYDDAEIFFIKAINIDPNFAPAYANLGVLYDRQEKYGLAISNYKKALQLDAELSKGMHWLDRLLYDVRETPSNIADRSMYLEKQMNLPKNERILNMPNIDDKQLNYER